MEELGKMLTQLDRKGSVLSVFMLLVMTTRVQPPLVYTLGF